MEDYDDPDSNSKPLASTASTKAVADPATAMFSAGIALATGVSLPDYSGIEDSAGPLFGFASQPGPVLLCIAPDISSRGYSSIIRNAGAPVGVVFKDALALAGINRQQSGRRKKVAGLGSFRP